MKYQKGENLEDWAKRVKMFEQGVALQKIAKGESPEEVLEDMARRIVDKLMYPIFDAIRESVIKDEAARPPTEVTGQTPKGVADHVVDD